MPTYKRSGMLGKGAMGEVYASQDDAGRPVAIKNVRKTISRDAAMTDRLADEARLLERVVHHNVVRAVDRGVDADGAPYFVMSYAEGKTLWQIIEREGPLALERAFALASQILSGLGAIHEARIVHADIKSNNILVDEQDRVTIIDFGLARSLSRELPRDNLVCGTPAFMAPELVSGAPPAVAADIYAVGVVLYEMITGMTPFVHSRDIFDAHRNEPVIPPSLRAPNQGITPQIDALVLRALDKEPAQRFTSARDFATALDAARSKDWRNTTLTMASTRVKATKDLGIRPTQEYPRAPSEGTTRVRDIISDALDAADHSIDSHDLYGAIAVIENGISALMSLDANATLDAEAWRLESVLAALYANLGRRSHAIRMANLASEHARRSGSAIGIERTQTLVERLKTVYKQAVLARGSVVPPRKLASGTTRPTSARASRRK